MKSESEHYNFSLLVNYCISPNCSDLRITETIFVKMNVVLRNPTCKNSHKYSITGNNASDGANVNPERDYAYIKKEIKFRINVFFIKFL